MVGAGLACSAGAMLCGEGGVVASSGRGGGKGGDSALGALEARSWKASTMVVMRNARMSVCATQSLCGSTLIHRALVSANSSATVSFVDHARDNVGTPILFLMSLFRCRARRPYFALLRMRRSMRHRKRRAMACRMLKVAPPLRRLVTGARSPCVRRAGGGKGVGAIGMCLTGNSIW